MQDQPLAQRCVAAVALKPLPELAQRGIAVGLGLLALVLGRRQVHRVGHLDVDACRALLVLAAPRRAALGELRAPQARGCACSYVAFSLSTETWV